MSVRSYTGAVLALVLGATACPAVANEDTRGLEAAPFDLVRVGTLRDRALREVSGMAVSRRDPNVIWVHNDSGSGPILHAIGAHGGVRARLRLNGATAKDWEDMASFTWNGKPMLMVADVGDNNARRSAVWLHVFEEPDLAEAEDSNNIDVDLAWSIPFQFPEGAADCESVAVDTSEGRVLLLTKRQNPPMLYSLPLAPEGALPGRGKVRKATLLGPVNSIPRPTAADLLADPVFGAFSSQPTSMDVAGRELVVLTYAHAYRYVRAADQDWAEALSAPPQIVLLPRMKQTEAVTFSADGSGLYVTSERHHAPIYRLDPAVRAPEPPAATSETR
ncbi:MAG: hypothetical protein AAFU65_02070 [Pseudomonadota bacterium]